MTCLVKGLEGLGSLEGLENVWKVDKSVKEVMGALLSLNMERPAALNTEVLEKRRHGVFVTGFAGFGGLDALTSTILSILSKLFFESPPCLPSSVSSRALAGSSLRSLSLCDLPSETLCVSSAHVLDAEGIVTSARADSRRFVDAPSSNPCKSVKSVDTSPGFCAKTVARAATVAITALPDGGSLTNCSESPSRNF